MEIIIVSDGSNDSTPEIVKRYEEQGVKSLHLAQRRGKTAALNRAIEFAKNEIIIFSDANSMFKKDAVTKLIQHFNDRQIGGVCGRKSVLIHKNRQASTGDNLFWILESKIKQAESNLGSIPVADGEIFAIRKSLYEKIPEEIINDDMAITFNIVSKGLRVIYEIEAVTEEEASITLTDDFNVKARMVYGALQILNIFEKELNPLKSWFGFQFFIHKTLRYFMWRLLIIIYISNILIILNHIFYVYFFILQSIFYLFAIIGYFLNRKKVYIRLFYLPFYYCNVNIAAYRGHIYFEEKQNTVNIWTKAER